ncbi:uncharacterized protein isoform X3 [Rhodnius prolixus]|uniref:uncharacterized protein isoform X3 n=1 Tax=Rhodnius prolixus TaxID=13249 RepID=UPI003D18D1FC
MFNFFKRKNNVKEDRKEPKRPPRKNEMGMNHSINNTNKTIPAHEIYHTPPGSPILKQKKPITLTTVQKKRSVPNKTISSTGTRGGDLDDEDDSKASPPNNVNNVLPASPPNPLSAPSSAAEMGNNISKLEDNIGDWPTTTPTTTYANNEDPTAVPNRLVSETNNCLMDTTNKHVTNISNNINNSKKLPVTDKTENAIDLKENAFLTETLLKTTNICVNTRDAESQVNKTGVKFENNQKKDCNVESRNQEPNISLCKNSEMNRITQSLTTKEKNGIEASKLTSININLENKNNFKEDSSSTKNDNLFNENNKNNDPVDHSTTEESKNPIKEGDQPITFIDDTVLDNEKDNSSNEISGNTCYDIEQAFQEDVNTEVSVLVKETREMILSVSEKDNTKKDYTENVDDNMILDSPSGKPWLRTCSAVNQVIEREGKELLQTTINEVKDDVKESSANDIPLGGIDVLSCQQKIPVNSQPCTHCEPSTDNTKKMLSIRTSTTGLETFSSSPPKVTDSETEEDSSSREFLPKSDLEEKDEDNSMKMKKRVHWADSEGRTLESFEQCSSSEEDEAVNEDESDVEQGDGEVNKNEKSSSEEESSSSEDETVESSKGNLLEYKRQDTWLDVIDEVSKSNTSDASEPSTKDDSGEEETSEEENSESEEEDENEDSKNDEEDYKEEQTSQNADKTDSIMNTVDLDSRSLIPVHELYEQITKLQQEIMVKASGIERQRAELEAAYIESEAVKQKSIQLENELHEYKCRNTELTLRICNAESKLLSEGDVEKLKEAEKKVVELEAELEQVRQDKLKLEESIKKLERERDQEIQLIRQALDATLTEQEAMEVRYKKEFEQLRSLNSNREVQMLDDFEWKLREVERLGKKKLADTEKDLTEKVKELTTKLNKAEQELAQVAHLQLCEIELKQLRTTAHEHRKNLRTVTRQLEDLQVDEKILQEEVSRLRIAVDREKAQIIALQNSHKDEIAEKDRKTQFKLQVQMNQINSEWEEKLKRELARLKSDLEKVFREEKMLAVETEKRIKEHEITNHRQIWEKKLEDIKMEIDNYKKRLEEKEEKHRLEMESAQTHSDRDVLDLRRKMDKLDMQYQEKIEKLQEAHEKEILVVKQECEKKIQQCESSVQMQMGTTRTTLELVKQQMANECEMRIEQLKRIHQEQLEDQWEQMQLGKEAEIKQLEEEHRKALELLEKKLEEYKKRNNDRSEVSAANTNITKLFNSFMRLLHQAVTPSLKKQPSKETSVHSQTKEEEKQISNELSNREQMSVGNAIFVLLLLTSLYPFLSPAMFSFTSILILLYYVIMQ